jgi:hypothetical protein
VQKLISQHGRHMYLIPAKQETLSNVTAIHESHPHTTD